MTKEPSPLRQAYDNEFLAGFCLVVQPVPLFVSIDSPQDVNKLSLPLGTFVTFPSVELGMAYVKNAYFIINYWNFTPSAATLLPEWLKESVVPGAVINLKVKSKLFGE